MIPRFGERSVGGIGSDPQSMAGMAWYGVNIARQMPVLFVLNGTMISPESGRLPRGLRDNPQPVLNVTHVDYRSSKVVCSQNYRYYRTVPILF